MCFAAGGTGALHKLDGTMREEKYVDILKKHLKDDQWKQDAPGLNFESHSKGSEYLGK